VTDAQLSVGIRNVAVDGAQSDEQMERRRLVTEIILQQGFPLYSKITSRERDFKQNKVRLIESEACRHRLFVCFDPKIKEDTIPAKNTGSLDKLLELCATRLSSSKSEDIFVCLDSALTDQAKMRLADVCRLTII
jgi:adenine-specific DNA-methyltransferase